MVKVHANIRKNPGLEKKERSKPSETKHWKAKKLTYDERKQKLKVMLYSRSCCNVMLHFFRIWGFAVFRHTYSVLH